MHIRRYLILLLMLPALLVSGQQPTPQKREFLVQDNAHLMSRGEVVRLGRKLSDYAKSTGIQILVYTTESLNGEDPMEFATKLGHEWGVGGEKDDNGIVLLVSKKDRKIRIQTGYGSEVFLPDAIAKRIIDNILTPAFRKGRFYAGLDRATDAIMELGSEEYKPKKNFNVVEEEKDGIPIIYIIILIIAIFVLLSILGNHGGGSGGDDGGYDRDGRYDYPGRRRRGGGWIFFPGGGFGGGGHHHGGGSDGGFGGFGGGGFGGFGGGGFGGGGAGGSW